MSKSSHVLGVDAWVVSDIKYMPPKINASGGKSVNIISTQTNRGLAIGTPLMMTWGASDYDENGKYSMSLNFPLESTLITDKLLKKFKSLEDQIIDDAVKNSELWFGEIVTREALKFTFFPIIKYGKDKESKKIDYSKPPSIRGKLPNYGGKWSVEIYDATHNLIFPCDDPNITPMDFIPKLSDVECVLGISQIWIGGKNWGCTLKIIQCVVKPRDVTSVSTGKCHLPLADEYKNCIQPSTPVKSVQSTTMVTDTDDEEEVEEIVVAPPMVVKKVVKSVSKVVEVPIAPKVKVPDVSNVEVPDVSKVEVPDVSIVEVPIVSNVEISDVSKVEVSVVPKVVKKITKKKVV